MVNTLTSLCKSGSRHGSFMTLYVVQNWLRSVAARSTSLMAVVFSTDSHHRLLSGASVAATFTCLYILAPLDSTSHIKTSTSLI